MKTYSIVAAAILLTTGFSHAQTYIESPDAGQTLATAQFTGVSPGNPLTGISGSIATGGDADLFLIFISDPANFFATTVNGSTTIDTQLFLLTLGGNPIFLNDDAASGLSLGSTLPAGSLSLLTPGFYFLGISLSGVDPVTAANQVLFDPSISSTGLAGPNPALTGPLGGFFDSGFGNTPGSYLIQLGGAQSTAVPEPSTNILILLAVGLIALRLRFRPRALALAISALIFSVGSALAGPYPGNIGGGLEVLYRDHLMQIQATQSGKIQRGKVADPGLDALHQQAADILSAAVRDKSGRVSVTIHLNGDVSVKQVADALTASGKLEITAQSSTYRNGAIEGWIRVADAAEVARVKGVSTVILSLAPLTNVGLVTQQGVNRHRVDQIPQFDGTGISVGALSDSFNTSTATIKAPNDVASGDLPGAGNPAGNLQDVVVLQDFPAGTDEGRAMLQVIHDMAPKARIAFATGNVGGQLGFANNIRALAALPGFAYPAGTQQGFKADIIVDDLIYFAEPMFSDGIVAQGVNDVTAAGVHYFSSAGNRPSTNAYGGTFNFVDPSNAAAIAASNVNLTGVSPALYAGGFHNFRTDGSFDIAQTVTRTVGSGTATNRIVFQWDEAFDLVTPGTQVYSNSGVHPGTGNIDFTDVALTAGVPTRIVVAAPPPSTFDAIVTILDPNNTVVTGPIDTGTDETIFFTPALTGNYTVRVGSFGSTTGAFTVQAFANSAPALTTDYNLLFFDPTTGAFINSLAVNNFTLNEPIESGNIPGFSATRSSVAMVIARANTPSPANANRLRYVIYDSSTATVVPSEYVGYQYPVTYGHNSARNGNGVAAYGPFRPFIPESFSSPGPSTIVFDAAGNRLANPEVRQTPSIAAMDGANNTFFSSDSANDADTFPNFFGTSCAAPNAAACAALVLQSHGGPGSLTTAQMKSILQSTAFPHDLDPYYARAEIKTQGGRLTIIVRADPSNSSAGQTVVNGPLDTKVVSVNYVGAGAVKSLTLDLTNGNTTGGDDTGLLFPGLVWDTRPVASGGLPFILGTLVGLSSTDIVPNFTNQAPAPSVAGQFFTLTLTFTDNAFSGGKSFTFNCDRDEQRTASLTAPATAGGNSADHWGTAVNIPAGTQTTGGVAVSVTMMDNSVFTGVFMNRVGSGYSPLDGFGFINAQAAVSAPVPSADDKEAPTPVKALPGAIAPTGRLGSK